MRQIDYSRNRRPCLADWATVLMFILVWTITPVDLRAADDPGAALREQYLDVDGLPSAAAYLEAHGLLPAPGSETYSWRVTFKLTYLSRDIARLSEASPLATDCYLTRTRRYVAPHRRVEVWDGRVYPANDQLIVAAFSSAREQVVGSVVDGKVRFTARSTSRRIPLMEHDALQYDPFSGRLWRRAPGGSIVEEQNFYLPLEMIDEQGHPISATFDIVRGRDRRFTLALRSGTESIVVASCDVKRGRERPGYSPEVGPGCNLPTTEPTTVLEVDGELSRDVLVTDGPRLVLTRRPPEVIATSQSVVIDGDFTDWRNVVGITDPRGDVPGYLQYTPDADLLEFKVSSDDRYLYFYTRVVGRHGNTAAGDRNDRYYYYVYIDADRNPQTGYVPTRDDDCYYGVTLGDDCESQFEFVGGRFVKTFFGFTGAGGEREVLSGKVRLAPSFYSKKDSEGNVRDRYKVEYVQQGDELSITQDYTEGTSDNIIIALSPDGSECEMRTALEGFLRDEEGRLIIGPGQQIDLAVGVEAAGKVRGNRRWGADSTAAIRSFKINDKIDGKIKDRP